MHLALYHRHMLLNIENNFTNIIFADDCTLLNANTDIDKAMNHTNDELKKVKDWFDSNKLLMNTDKTTVMLVSPKNKPKKELLINIGMKKVRETNVTPFLGIQTDKNLTFITEYEKNLKKVHSGLSALISVKYQMNYVAKIKIYHGLIQSHLTYCPLIWMLNLPAIKIKTLETLQNKALRAVFKAPYNCHTEPLYQLSGVVKVSNICENDALKIMYQYQRNELPKAITKMIDDSIQKDLTDGITTRNNKFKINKNIKKGDLMYEIITYWNNCDCEIKNKTRYSLKSAKDRIKKYLRDKAEKICKKINCNNCAVTDTKTLKHYMTYMQNRQIIK